MINDCPYEIEQFGITLRETELIFAQINGLTLALDVRLPYGFLGDTIRDAAHSSADDHRQFKLDLPFPKGDSPQMPAILRDLARKVDRLDWWKQDAITYYAMGFWAGIRAAEMQDEATATLQAAPVTS